MPWTAFFLAHLLEYDCPIVIGEGAVHQVRYKSARSIDGSLELIQDFANTWSDRVTLHYHDIKDKRVGRAGSRRPKFIAKMKAWNMLKDGEWMLGLAPDNYYLTEDIPRLKEVMRTAHPDIVTLLTGMRVFVFNFRTHITKRKLGLCGPWVHYWPCIYRKNPQFILRSGSELLWNKERKKYINSPSVQGGYGKKGNKRRILVAKDIVQFHYKGVKSIANRVNRWGAQEGPGIFQDHMIQKTWTVKYLKEYDGPHPAILDNHPWRYVYDCRAQKPKFNYKDYLHLIERRES